MMSTDYLKLALLCLAILVEGVMIYKAWGRWRKIIFLGASAFLLFLVLVANLYRLAQ